MKTYFFVMVAAAVLAACSKNAKPVIERDTLTGNWQLIEEYVSAGGPGKWQPADPQHLSFVSFGEDSIVFTVDGKSTNYHIETVDSASIKFSNPQGEYFYRYSIENNELTLSPPCIEGCMQKYTPILKID
jgi:hypothetical protein